MDTNHCPECGHIQMNGTSTCCECCGYTGSPFNNQGKTHARSDKVSIFLFILIFLLPILELLLLVYSFRVRFNSDYQYYKEQVQAYQEYSRSYSAYDSENNQEALQFTDNSSSVNMGIDDVSLYNMSKEEVDSAISEYQHKMRVMMAKSAISFLGVIALLYLYCRILIGYRQMHMIR